MVSDLPNGVDTLIGKDGIRLSGGEYKKIALARLFYHDKDILILDEATNSLDKESEEIVINELHKNCHFFCGKWKISAHNELFMVL